jgi:hypothetical protein
MRRPHRVCVDNAGVVERLTTGRTYWIVNAGYDPKGRISVFHVFDDKGSEAAFGRRHMESIPSDGSVLAYNEACEDRMT